MNACLFAVFIGLSFSFRDMRRAPCGSLFLCANNVFVRPYLERVCRAPHPSGVHEVVKKKVASPHRSTCLAGDGRTKPASMMAVAPLLTIGEGTLLSAHLVWSSLVLRCEPQLACVVHFSLRPTDAIGSFLRGSLSPVMCVRAAEMWDNSQIKQTPLSPGSRLGKIRSGLPHESPQGGARWVGPFILSSPFCQPLTVTSGVFTPYDDSEVPPPPLPMAAPRFSLPVRLSSPRTPLLPTQAAAPGPIQ